MLIGVGNSNARTRRKTRIDESRINRACADRVNFFAASFSFFLVFFFKSTRDFPIDFPNGNGRRIIIGLEAIESEGLSED